MRLYLVNLMSKDTKSMSFVFKSEREETAFETALKLRLKYNADSYEMYRLSEKDFVADVPQRIVADYTFGNTGKLFLIK